LGTRWPDEGLLTQSEERTPAAAIDRWPHIGQKELRALWDMHAPPFLAVDDVDAALPALRLPFLNWLEQKGIDLSHVHPMRHGKRARLDRVSLRKAEDTIEAEVVLTLFDKTVQSSKQGLAASADNLVRLPAQAVLEGVKLLLPIVEFDIEEAFTIARGGSDDGEIAVVIAREAEQSNTRFVGAADVKSSPSEAAAKAALSAINRHAEIAAGLFG
jgi:hypothetical protein